MAATTMELVSTVLGSPNPRKLARFYERLLGWKIRTDDEDWVTLRPESGPGLSFQLETDHVPPVWPSGPGDQQMMMHLDIYTDDVPAAVAAAIEAGATLASHQPQDDVRVMIDPDGHPFCFFDH